MEWHRKIIYLIVSVVLGLSCLSIGAYPFLPSGIRELSYFTLLVGSAWTSVTGLAVSLWLFNQYQETIENPLEDLTDKTNVLVEDLDEGFLEEFIDSLIRAEKRFASLPREKQKRVVRMVDNAADNLLQRVEDMPEKPEKKINTVESKEG